METIKVRVIPNAKKALVSEDANGLRDYVRAAAEGGKANRELLELLAEYLSVKKSSVEIIRGFKSREKVIKINSE
ncbi:MAG: DUF167 domain-containing protein [Candidatus Aenigmarchaeota archaeon]|nr:DUF167 domain-containing protein [Candidatus Aenigmarchaeota archaeon]